MTKYGRSPWADRAPKSRIPSYPRQRGSIRTDVAIVGGGLTGCATAYALAAAGVKVVLVEANAVGRGSNASANGWIADDPGPSFIDIDKALGRKPARHVWQAWRRAALDFGALLRRLNVKAGFEARDTLTVAFSPEQNLRLAKEQKARRTAGLDAPMVNGRMLLNEVGAPAIAAIRGRNGSTLDPFRAALGLAAAAVDRGALFFEKSPATRVTFGPKSAQIKTGGGTIEAGRVIVATGVPTPLFRALRRHFWFDSGFLALTEPVPAKIRKLLGDREAVIRDYATPQHVIRWVDDDRLLVSGADSASPAPRLLEKTIVQRTGQLMYELSTIYPDISGILPAYGWEAPYARTADGLPFIGPHRNYPFHLFAFGDSSRSVTGAYLASRILLRHILDEADAADEAFGFNRYGHVR